MSEQPTILLAEDDPDQRQVKARLLERCGCRVILAADGEEAVRLALDERPDMILMDLRMPVMDGFKAAAMLRNEPSMRSVVLIAYTAYHSYTISEDAHAVGFDEYITKPITIEAMRELVARYLPGATAEKEENEK